MEGGRGFFKDVDALVQFPPDGIFSTVVAKGVGYNYTLMCLSKGTELEEHTSTSDGVVYVLRGKGIFTLFGKRIAMKPGILIFMPKNAPHEVRASEDLAFLLCLTR